MFFVAVAGVAALSALSVVSCENMNGRYKIANPSTSGSTPFQDDYSAKGYEYFDLWAPEIATRYSEVFWRDQLNQPLPQAIIDRFANKTIAIMGYEHDQVMVIPQGQPGVNPDKDVSVPINWVYNHHYSAYMTGVASEMVPVPPNEQDRSAHGSHLKYKGQSIPGVYAPPDIPTSQFFSEGNGGESRKSYHGYPQGYAQLIYSPDKFHVIPMQIDTRNRDCGVTPDDIYNCTQFIPGPEPKQARYGRVPPAANISGLVECPCNSRYGGDSIFYPSSQTKMTQHSFYVKGTGACGATDTITDADSCYKAVDAVNIHNVNATAIHKVINDPSFPRGCSVVTADKQTPIVYFNQYANSDAVNCSTGTSRSGFASSDVGTSVQVSLDLVNNAVDITLTGPNDVWFGFGFNAQKMADAPWAIIVEATAKDALVSERKIGTCGDEGKHCPGTLLNSSFSVVSQSTAQSGDKVVRTVVLRRSSLAGPTSDYFTFTSDMSSIPFISAIGSMQTISYHAAHTSGVISLITDDGNNCVCDQGASGAICDVNGGNCSSFTKNCAPEPFGDLVQQQNPTCTSRQYGGGLSCCGDGRFMIDQDQPIPDQLLRYHLKFRFWFQEYVETPTPSHYNLERVYVQTETDAGEYDVPPAFVDPSAPAIVGYPDWPVDTPTPGTTCTGDCPNGDDCDCLHTIHYSWTWDTDMRLLYAGGHCHAPSCRSLDLYRNDSTTGLQLVCSQTPVFGTGDVKTDKYDEADFIQIPPCLWGDEEGLEPSFLIPAKTQMVSIKKNSNTKNGHFGEMASWQMRGTFF